MKHIATKLLIGFLAMTFLTVVILWAIQAGVMRNSYVNERVSRVDEAIVQAVLQDRTDYADLGEQINASLVVFDKKGAVIFRSQGLPMMGMMLRTLQEMHPGADAGKPMIVEAGSQSRYALLGRPMPDGGSLFAVFSLADVDEAARLLRHQLWIVTVVLLAASLVLAFLLSDRLARPIRAVTEAAGELARGNLAVKLPVTSRDEIGQLTTALNTLSVELARTEQLRKELIANVSHELRAPLSVIRGYAETVRDITWPQEEKRNHQLDMIVSEADRLTGIVRDILDYSRLQSGVEKLEPVQVDLYPLLDQVRSQYEQTAQNNHVRLILDCQAEHILFDQNRFKQVMHNLLSNAINHADPETAIEIHALQQDRHCRISVANQGDTIPASDLEKIWERYYRSGQSGSRPIGTGLGLAIVKTILDQHQAAYGVSSQDGITTFWFAMPVSDD